MASSWDSYLADASYSAVGAYDPSGYGSYDSYQPNYATDYSQSYDYGDYYGFDPGYTLEQQAYDPYAATPVYQEPQADPYQQSYQQQSQGATSTGRYDASQYLMENTYSTGEYAPEHVWADPGPTQAEQNAWATGRHESRQYLGDNVYSTGPSAPDGVWREQVTLPTVDQTGRQVQAA